jgi:CRISPR/Cas system CSM-associated protein Csm3 (group 7 of RAMP superfamily)
VIITAIKADIEVEAGWAVGTSDIDAIGIDRELLTEPDGRPWVPPSSLAGSLRAHLVRHHADERLMGSRPPLDDAQPAPPLVPSALWLLGTRVRRAGAQASSKPPSPRTEVVASTAVDARRRAAVPKSLRHSRVVDEAAVIGLYAMLEGELTEDDRQVLGKWQPEVGRDRTRGAGRAHLKYLGYRSYDLDDPADLRTWLENAGTDRFKGLTPVDITAKADAPLLDAEFVITDALHVGTGSRRDKKAVIRARSTSPLVPASTWKGLFRARARYIMRSCWHDDTACVEQEGCGHCLLCDLFGSTTRRARIGFQDSVVTQAHVEPRNHVAIDRISGGGRDKLLFTDNVVVAGRVRLSVLSLGTFAEWERDLLLHVVADIHDGLIGVGGGAQRGQGTLRLTDASHPALTVLKPMPSRAPVAEIAT